MKKITDWIQIHKKIVTLLLAVIFLSGFGWWWKIRKSAKMIRTEPVIRGTIYESVYGIGTVIATRTFQLKVGVANTIQRLYVREGDRVKRGDRLVNMDGTVFTARFEGTITALPFKTGETVFADSPILTLTDLDDRYLLVSLDQQGALLVHPGQNAKINIDSMRNETFEGVVQSAYSNNGNFLVRIGVRHLAPEVLPGMTVDVAITIDQHEKALLAPVAAIQLGNVWLNRDHRSSEQIPVKIGFVDGAMAEIVGGNIHEGDRVEIRQALKL